MAKDINVTFKSASTGSKVVLGSDELEVLNKEIVRLIRTQAKNLVNTFKTEGGNLVNVDAIKGMELELNKGTVQSILLSIKKQLLPILTNPTLPTDKMKISFSRKDFKDIYTKLQAKIKAMFDIDLTGLNKIQPDSIEAEMQSLFLKLNTSVQQYINNMVSGLNAIDPAAIQMPINNLSKSLRRYIAKDLGTSVEQLEKVLGKISLKDANYYKLKSQFERLEKVLNNKVSGGIQKEIDALVTEIEAIHITPNVKIKHKLNSQMNRLNKAIVTKIRENIDTQVNALLGEIASSRATIRPTRRTGKLAPANNSSRPTIDTPTPIIRQRDTGFSYERFAKSSEHMNNFGLHGAVVNTIRHIIAGTMVGVPIMAMKSNSMFDLQVRAVNHDDSP